MHFFKTINKNCSIEFKEKNSKFIGIAIPISSISEVNEIISQYKKEHPKATHVCYAAKMNEQEFRYSDDGEVNNTAGLPIFGQINSFELRQLIVIVIRYYGGQKLGVRGLIDAYKNAANLVLESAEIIEKEQVESYEIKVTMEEYINVISILKTNDIVFEQAMDSYDACFMLQVPLSKKDKLKEIIEKYT